MRIMVRDGALSTMIGDGEVPIHWMNEEPPVPGESYEVEVDLGGVVSLELTNETSPSMSYADGFYTACLKVVDVETDLLVFVFFGGLTMVPYSNNDHFVRGSYHRIRFRDLGAYNVNV